MNHRSKGQLMCRLEGCPHEVLFKAVDGGGYVDPLERRASGISRNNPLQGRGSPADARCPVPECNQARLQYLDPAYESRHSDTGPVYQRWEYCADHKCTIRRCPRRKQSAKAIYCKDLEGKFSYCAIHVKCDISNCNRARHNVSGTKDYLRFCTDHCCAEGNCRFPRPWAASPTARGKFCPLHTCRAQDCPEFVDRLAIFCRTHGCSKPKCHEEVIVEGFCLDHLKAHYITQGELKARGGSSSSSKDPPTTLITRPGTGPVAANLQPPNFPRRLSQQSIASIRPGPGPGQRPTSVLHLHGHAHEILIPPDEHPDEMLDGRDNAIKFLDHQSHQAHQAHVDDPDSADLDDDDDVDDHLNLPNLNPSSLNSHLSHVSHH
ncbi:hypothetical protein N0V85_008896, partial [Neurospora sp. IMI 360204]